MSAVFADDLRTVHPAEPEIDVTTSRPFLERMQDLWSRGMTYQITRYLSSAASGSDSEVWGELIAFDATGSVLASEVVLYRISQSLVREICVYKVMSPKHPNYQIHLS